LDCGGPAPLWPVPAWRGFIEKHSTMTGQLGELGQSAARPAHSKELTLSFIQTFLQFVGRLITLIDKPKFVGHNICMPIYEFECKKCGAHTEVFQKMNDKQPTKCRKCGGRLERLVSASAIQFKGSGFYLTDYGRSGQKASEKKEGEATSNDDKKSDKAEKKTKDNSPSKKTSEKASSTKVSTGD
jgi:putative FmdB family regulatory protein